MTPEGLDALRGLFPGEWQFEEGMDGHVRYRILLASQMTTGFGGKVDRLLETATSWSLAEPDSPALDHLTQEAKRRVLAKASYLRISHGTHVLVEIIVTVGETGGWYSAKADTELDALLDAWGKV